MTNLPFAGVEISYQPWPYLNLLNIVTLISAIYITLVPFPILKTLETAEEVSIYMEDIFLSDEPFRCKLLNILSDLLLNTHGAEIK